MPAGEKVSLWRLLGKLTSYEYRIHNANNKLVRSPHSNIKGLLPPCCHHRLHHLHRNLHGQFLQVGFVGGSCNCDPPKYSSKFFLTFFYTTCPKDMEEARNIGGEEILMTSWLLDSCLETEDHSEGVIPPCHKLQYHGPLLPNCVGGIKKL